jgi:TRAP-type C4-dicarboxylate transport system substrate-binding protein
MQALAKLKDAVEAVSTGVADIAYVIPAYSQSKLPLWYLSSTAVGSADQYIAAEAWLRVRARFPEIAAEEGRNNFQYLGHYSIGPSVLISRSRPYLTPADFQGDKVRLSSRYLRAAKANSWKVTSVQLVLPEVYTGLERGTLDGALTYLTQILQYRHNEVSKFVVQTNSGQQTNLLVMNLRTWKSLTDRERAVLTELQPLYRERIAQASLTEAKAMQQKLEKHPKHPLRFSALTESQRRVWENELKGAERFDIEQSARWAPQAATVYAAYLEEQQKVTTEIRAQRYPWERTAAR